jgi:hypothetical protein
METVKKPKKTKSSRRKGVKKKKRTRTIPKKISQAVKARHDFQCAWCGEPMTDRHHIKEWHLGGAHEEANLILLCPNHHRMAHNNQITSEQLISRKSTHLKNDRIPGGFRTTLEHVKFKLGNNVLEDIRHLIAHEYQPILTVECENEDIYFSANFFDEKGDLIFWMRRNNFWAPSFFEISSSLDQLRIYDRQNEKMILTINRDGEHLAIECSTYLDKALFEVNNNRDVVLSYRNREIIFGENIAKNGHVGFWVAGPEFTEEEFLRLNKEETDLVGVDITIRA